MKGMKKIKIGQIGIGHNHATALMSAVRKFPQLFEVVGYAEDKEDWVIQRGNHPAYQGLKRLTVEEIIEQSDAVLVETEVPDLTAYAKRCVDAGKHIHMDKPASGTYEEFSNLLQAAKEKNLTVQLGYMYRNNYGVKKCLELIKDGKLGEIYSINAEMSTYHTPEYKRWLTTFDGGIMYILGCHLVDLILYILGEPKKITKFFKRTHLDGIDFADNNLVVMEYEKAIARVFVSSVEVNGWGRRQFFVSGSKGSIDIRPIENEIRVTYSDLEIADTPYGDRKRVLDIQDIPPENRYDDMVQEFYDQIVNGTETPFTFEHELALKKIMDSICFENE